MSVALTTPGTLIAGKYRVERTLGEGAMGVVVAARHVDLDEVRAIKLMLPSHLGDVEGVERFLREARAAVRLKSQHVARVLDVGRLDDGTPFIVMEYLDGEDLKSVLEARGALPMHEAADYLLQACEAVAEAHAAGIVHRDLKPANLFVTKGPNGAAFVKVLDFGIAKMAPAAGEPGVFEMTKTTEIVGTPVFMSPEQMRSMRDVDARADVWAIGVVLYRALTGSLPFSGSTITQVCASVVADTPASPSALRPDLPRGIDAIVMRCLEKDPARRFASATDLASALTPFTVGAVTVPGAHAPLPLQPIPPLGVSPPQAAASSTAGGVTTGTAGLWSKPNAPTEQSSRALVAGVTAAGLVAALGITLIVRALSQAVPGEVHPAADASSTAPSAAASSPIATRAPAPLPTVAPSATPSASAAATARASASPSVAPRETPPRPPRSKDAYGDSRK